MFSVGSKLLVCWLTFIFLTTDRLKRSSMRTQATQTDVKKIQTQPPSNVSTATALQQKHASSPGGKLKVFFFSFFLISKFSIWQTWMVSESVQTNGLTSPSYPSLKRAQSARAGYHVQVYDLDAPIQRNSNVSQPRRNCSSVDQQVNYSSNSVKLDYDNIEGRQAKLR